MSLSKAAESLKQRLVEVDPLSVRCSYCQAAKATPCWDRFGNKPVTGSAHYARWRRALAKSAYGQ